MIFKKFCTIHALEYNGEKCPECEKSLSGNVSLKKKDTKVKSKSLKKKKEVRQENEDVYNSKLKELVEKYS